MSTRISQLRAVAMLQIRLWLRTPKHAAVSMALSIAFLVLANRVMVIRLGHNVCVGIHTTQPDVARSAERQFSAFDLTTVRYDSLEQGRRDLDADRIVGLMSVAEGTPPAIRMIFGGRNPLVDRELASILLRVSSDISTNAVKRSTLTMENNRYTPDVMTTFMTSGLIPFLIFALASVNFGLLWLNDYERGTLYTQLASPVPRWVLVLGRAAGSMPLILLTFSVAVIVCRLVVPWEIGPRPLLWCGAILLQIAAMCGVFFAMAMLCRRFALYTDVSLILALILMFLSGALTPVATMPDWARVLGAMTPTYYAVRLTRAIMLGTTPVLALDVIALMFWAVAGFACGYTRVLTATIDRRS